MMAIVPALMALYSSDAVEIRYSDGSRLELSPCGSSMVHIESPNTRGYPAYGQARKFQKRTRFVTSEHRHKVLQALDFRNRFAERSYLCEDLLPREEIVALYAKIDKIAWPRKLEDAKIDILADGSRSITSRDEFATMIISPHGHDFTVCFLSRIGQDKRRSKDNIMRKSDSVSHGASLQSSSGNMCTFDKKHSSNLNEVLVCPFEKSGHLDVRLSGYIDHSQVTEDLKELQITKTFLACEIKSGNLKSDNVSSQDVSTGIDSLIRTYDRNDKEQKLQHTRDDSDNAGKLSFNQNNENDSNPTEHSDLCCFSSNSLCRKEKQRPTVSFFEDCPNSRDISSISRSSTPDGLRTTLDFDVTLMHNDLSGNVTDQRLNRKQTMNSPVQYTSSPFNAQTGLSSEKSNNEVVSLSGSFLGNQNSQNHLRESGSKTEIKQLIGYSVPGKDNSNSSTINSDRVAINGIELETSAVQTHEPIHNHPNQIDRSDTVKFLNQISDTSGDKTIHKLQDRSGLPEYLDKIVTSSDLNNDANNISTKINFSAALENIPSKAYEDQRQGSRPVLEGCSVDSDMCEKNKVEQTQERQCRERYIWTTKHCSTNDCPTMWAHPLKLLLEGAVLIDEAPSSNPTKEGCTNSAHTVPDRENCIFTQVPSPLPVTCPLQHCHRWMSNEIRDDDEDSATNPGELQHGRLKIVISEGVVFRLAQKADVKVVEIYPGDGSVFMSHRVQGHFFTHYRLVGDQLQERTYSLKSLPHRPSQLKYSIKRLIETANRLLVMNSDWERRGVKDDVPCWKKDVKAIVEPLSSSLLEECIVEGLGKFSAFTNGRVRIVFEDRTALDIVCNVSRRVQECLAHSQEPLVSLPCASSVSPPVPTYESVFGTSTGRLLLPSGEYVTVDITNPGPFRKYVQVAQEWAEWVRSSPKERQQFYAHHNTPAILQQAVEIELKKILCFNYILEQTLLMQEQRQQLNSKKTSANSNTPPTAQTPSIHPSNIPRPTPLSGHKDSSDNLHPNSDPPVQNHSFRSRSPEPTCPPQVTSHSYAFSSIRGESRDSADSRGKFESSRIVENPVMGFDSVRQVLLQNSSLISEIDAFLKNTRKI